MSLTWVLIIAVAYVALVLFVMAVLTAAKRADEDIARSIRAERGLRRRFHRKAEAPEPEPAPEQEEVAGGKRRGAA